MPRPLNHKPGTRKGLFVPDVIETYRPEGPTRLLDFLIEAMPQRKRTNIKELLAHDQVAVNSAPTRQFDTELSAGDEVKVNLVRPFLTFRNRRLRLVFEDDDIIVVDKGYGLLSMGTDKIKEGTAYSILRDYVKWSNPRNKIFNIQVFYNRSCPIHKNRIVIILIKTYFIIIGIIHYIDILFRKGKLM